MTLESRLRRLEDAAVSLIGPERCVSCGHPSPDGAGVALLDEAKGDAIGRCDECGTLLVPDGRPLPRLMPNGWIERGRIIETAARSDRPPPVMPKPE